MQLQAIHDFNFLEELLVKESRQSYAREPLAQKKRITRGSRDQVYTKRYTSLLKLYEIEAVTNMYTLRTCHLSLLARVRGWKHRLHNIEHTVCAFASL
jgi:hypothetical protein